MVIPFSNTKLRVPKGFQSLLVGLSTEILRSQPRNIHEFAAEYFEKLLQRREQGESYLPDKQTSLEDRYYNNPSFQEEYSVNDPEVNTAATKIQAKFRGHKARQDVDKMRRENKDIRDTDRQELGYNNERTPTPKADDHNQKSSRIPSAGSTKSGETKSNIVVEEDQPFNEELTEEEKEEQDRAARSIQARFRGHKLRKSPGQERSSPASDRDHGSDRPNQHDSDNEKVPSRPSTRQSGKLDSDRHDQDKTSEQNDTDRPRLEREPTQLSEDFERHTQVPRDSDFARENQENLDTDEFDMNDPHLDKAATRIQASFRGYKTRKELGTGGAPHDQHPHPSSSSHAHDDYDHANNKILTSSVEGNKETEFDDDDNSAAVKIQAAYRGYRVRKDLEK